MSLKPRHTVPQPYFKRSARKTLLIERAQAALAEARKNGTVEVITTKDGTQFLSVKMKPES
ncbi:hypothetical protein VRB95_17455 [Erwinia aphidicola]|uniref:hypothetical protein n=1 Tax=Erwinia aphidicola TaxID=68334 RepID=UPI00300C0937